MIDDWKCVGAVDCSYHGRMTGQAASVWIFCIQLFFVAMLVFPTVFQLQRGAFLGALLFIAAAVSIRSWAVHRDILLLWAATLIIGIFGVIWGIINSAPGALRVSTVHIIWPVVYFIFIGLVHDLSVIRKLETALVFGISIATVMSFLVLIGGVLEIGNLIFPMLYFLDAGFGGYDGYLEFRIYNLTTVMYGFPFIIAWFLAHRKRLSGWRLIWTWLLIATMLIIAVGSGRRMFWLLVLLTPFVALFFLEFSALHMSAVRGMRIGIKIIFLVMVMLGVAIFTLNLDIVKISQQFLNSFLGQEYSSALRFNQAAALWADFSQSPWLGKGLGSVSGVIRSEEMPWAYELWHLALLMNVGLLGYLVYAVAIVWLVAKGMVIARVEPQFAMLFIPLVTAMMIFLLMTATNPYLGKFDYLWVIFLPVALLNARLTCRSGNARYYSR